MPELECKIKRDHDRNRSSKKHHHAHDFIEQGKSKSKSGSAEGVPMPPEVCTTDSKRVMIAQSGSKRSSKKHGKSWNKPKQSKSKSPVSWWNSFEELQGTPRANQWHGDCDERITCRQLVASCTNNCLGTITCVGSSSNTGSHSHSHGRGKGRAHGFDMQSRSASHSNSGGICERLGGLRCIYDGESDDFRICSGVEDN